MKSFSRPPKRRPLKPGSFAAALKSIRNDTLDLMPPLPPCPRCLALAQKGRLRMETVQPLPAGAWAPRAHDHSGPCCYDCSAADTLVACTQAPGFEAARIAVGNERQEHYRLPPGVRMGLVKAGFVRPCERGAFKAQLEWLDAHKWFGREELDE